MTSLYVVSYRRVYSYVKHLPYLVRNAYIKLTLCIIVSIKRITTTITVTVPPAKSGSDVIFCFTIIIV